MIRSGLMVLALVVVVLSGVSLCAQQATTAIAPVPAALYVAKKVFISNAGADSGLFPKPFSGDTSRAYNEFYTDVKSLGRFEVVDRPEDADLVLELRLNAPYGPSNADKQKGASDPLPMFRLVVYDRSSHYVLWTLTRSIEVAVLQKTHDRNFDTAVAALAQDLKTVASPATAP